MYLILRIAVIGADCVAGLVEAGQALILVRNHMAALLRSCNHLDGRFLDVLHHDGLAALSGSQQSCLID